MTPWPVLFRRSSGSSGEIKVGRFKPDVTLSGQLQEPDGQGDQSSLSSSAPCSSSSEDAEANEREEEEQSLAPWMEPDRLIRNDSSRCIHVLKADGTLTCGRALPVKFSILDEVPAVARFSNGCF